MTTKQGQKTDGAASKDAIKKLQLSVLLQSLKIKRKFEKYRSSNILLDYFLGIAYAPKYYFKTSETNKTHLSKLGYR